jgi:hypothetical protein
MPLGLLRTKLSIMIQELQTHQVGGIIFLPQFPAPLVDGFFGVIMWECQSLLDIRTGLVNTKLLTVPLVKQWVGGGSLAVLMTLGITLG